MHFLTSAFFTGQDIRTPVRQCIIIGSREIEHLCLGERDIKQVIGRFRNGVDIYFSLDLNNNSKIIKVLGFQTNREELRHIKNYDIFENLRNKYGKENNRFEGNYDPFTRSGLITFYNVLYNDDSIKEDLYYIFVFLGDNDENSDIFVDIYIDAKNESKSILPKNKYIRGAFNLFNNRKYQNKTFYIEIENLENNYNYILEFSSNSKNIIPIFNNELRSFDNFTIEGITKYFISKENLIKGKKYNFTIQIKNTNKSQDNNDENYSLFGQNYIIKFYEEEIKYNRNFIINKTIEFEKMDIDGKFNCKAIIKNHKINDNYFLNKNYKYNYFVLLYLKKYFYQPQLLKTTAYIFYERNIPNIGNPVIWMNFTSDPNEELSFDLTNLLDNDIYVIYLFIKLDVNNNEEIYYSTSKEIDIKEDNDNKESLTTILIIFGIVILITLVIFIIIFRKCLKKNKNLKEQVQAISFSRGIDEDSFEKKNTKEDEDYESTFI